VLALSACGGESAAETQETTVDYVAFSVLKSANDPVFKAFQETDEGKGARFAASYGPPETRAAPWRRDRRPTSCTCPWPAT